MRLLRKRVLAMLLAVVMVVSILPLPALAAAVESPQAPVETEQAGSGPGADPEEAAEPDDPPVPEEGGGDAAVPEEEDGSAEAALASEGDATLAETTPPDLPGYTRVTNLSDLNTKLEAGVKDYLIIAPKESSAYALYLRKTKTEYGPGDLAGATDKFGFRTALLTVSGSDITAMAANSEQTALDQSVTLSQLHLRITKSGSSYAIKNNANSTYLMISSDTWAGASSTPISIADKNDGSFWIHSSARQMRFGYQLNSHGTDFWAGTYNGSGDGSSCEALYIYQKDGEPDPEPVPDPGSRFATMFTGDEINGDTTNTDPAGQNSWVFTGGAIAQGKFADVKGARSWAGHFEEYVRYTNKLTGFTENQNPSLQRHVINVAYDGQKLADIVTNFDTRIGAQKPRGVVYLVDPTGSTEANFATNLGTLITNSLALKKDADNKDNGVIAIAVLTDADKTAVEDVYNDLTAEQQVGVKVVDLSSAYTAGSNPDAKGHLKMAKLLAAAVTGNNLDSMTGWPFASASNLDATLTESGSGQKTTVTADHTGFKAPDTPTTAQAALQQKMTQKTGKDAANSMTWLFMGDSITHGSLWCGGYDTVAQSFEKFVKEDLNRPADIVINTGSSGATTTTTINDLSRRLLKYSPDVVVLMLGTNDHNNVTSKDDYKANLRELIGKIQDMGAIAVLRTPPPCPSRPTVPDYAGYMCEVANEDVYKNKVILVDQFTALANTFNWGMVSADSIFNRDTSTKIHPGEAGQLWMTHLLINGMGLWNGSSKICSLEYIAPQARTYPEIPGYTRITDDSSLQTGTYLLAAPFVENGETKYFVLYPGAEGGKAGTDNIRQLAFDDQGTITGLKMRDDTDAATGNTLASAHNTLAKAADGTHWAITAQHAEGETYALELTYSNQVYKAGGTSNLEITYFPDYCGFKVVSKSTGGSTLAYYDDSATNYHCFAHWGDLTNPKASGYFYLYRLNDGVIDDSALTDAITQGDACVKDYEKSQFTTESWTAMETALAEAKTVKNDASKTQAQVNTAASNLTTALDGLTLGPVTVPGYTQVTAIADVEKTENAGKGYLLVSRDAQGHLYAVYPSEDGKSLNAGALPAYNAAKGAYGQRTAVLTPGETDTTATYLKTDESLDMDDLLFRIKKSGEGYVFTSVNLYHLNMNDKMFEAGEKELTVTHKNDLHAFTIRNTDKNRTLDFSKKDDPHQFINPNSKDKYQTDFWCPNSPSMDIYIFASNDEAPTAKSTLQELVTEVKGEIDDGTLVEDNYTGKSWGDLQAALVAANALLASDSLDPNDEQFNTAYEALRTARDSLTEPPTVVDPPAGATKLELSQMLKTGTTQDAPFAAGTAESTNFRIPSIISLKNQSDVTKNGRLVAAIDARWNHTGDACSLDTILSYSDDNGKTWNYLFPNYFGDSTDARAWYGTAFIDPVMVEGSDGTIYLMVDTYPGGVAINTAPMSPAKASGFVTLQDTGEAAAKKRLVLYTTGNTGEQTDNNYAYYVGDFTDGGNNKKYAPVMEPISGAADTFSGFYVDEHYYLYKTAGAFADRTPANDKIWCQQIKGTGTKPNDERTDTWVQQNVFFHEAVLHVRNATYLWLVKSVDGGETWSAPQIVNSQVRRDEGETRHPFYGVGPGAGLCTTEGTVMLPCYIWDGSDASQRSSFIYTTDGETWKRSEDATGTSAWSSESCLVQIDDTTVRHFYRDGQTTLSYTDHTLDSTTGEWHVTRQGVNTGADKRGANGCQLSAIKYSQQAADGKDLILVSTPTGNGRSNGKIYAFKVNSDANHTMDLFKTYVIPNGVSAYAYSSLSETQDGDIALLFEGSSIASEYQVIPIEDIVGDNVVPEPVPYTVAGVDAVLGEQPHQITVTPDAAAVGATVKFLNDDCTAYDQSAAPEMSTAGTKEVYFKITANGYRDTYGHRTVTLTQGKVSKVITVTSDPASLTGGGTVTLTVTGAPETEVTLTMECDDTTVTLTPGTGNTWTATLPDATKTYTFTAGYEETNTYAAASGTCTVAVKASLQIPGYTRMSQDSAGEATLTNGQYLVVAHFGEDYFVLYPGEVGGVPENVRQLHFDANGQPDGLTTAGGTEKTHELEAAHNTLTVLSAAGHYSMVSGDYKLVVKYGHTAYQDGADETSDLTIRYDDGAESGKKGYTIYGDRYLCYWTGNDPHRFDQNGSLNVNGATDRLLLFRKAGTDFSALNAAITRAEALNESDYTGGWAELQTALSAAKAVAANQSSTQGQVDDALDALTAAMDGLQRDTLRIPGYTLVTPNAVDGKIVLDKTKFYMIVSQDSEGNLFALYPAAGGTSLGSGNAIVGTDKVKIAAQLAISGSTVTPTVVGGSNSPAMTDLHFMVEQNAERTKYAFVTTSGLYLSVGDNMLAETAQYLLVTAGIKTNAFHINNDTASTHRWLDFNKKDDSQSGNYKGNETNFWGPSGSGTLFPIYLYTCNEGHVPTAREKLEAEVDDCAEAGYVAGDYTGSTWKIYSAALKAAKDLLGSGSTDEDALSDALIELKAARAALQRGPVVLDPYHYQATVYQLYTGQTIEPGVYAVYSTEAETKNRRILYHTGTDAKTNQVVGSLSEDGQRLTLTGGQFDDETQLWEIAGNETDGYTMKCLDSGRYLDGKTASASGVNVVTSPVAMSITKQAGSDCWHIGGGGQYVGHIAGGAFKVTSTAENLWLFKQTEVTLETDPSKIISDWHTLVPNYGKTDAQTTTQNAPFPQGTANSNNFRIPSLITLQNGNLLAAIDARWNHLGDACSLDTILSYSEDNGATWHWSFPNYFGDSTDAKAEYGTAFIDPVMTQGNDGTIYLMVDAFPGGVALNTAPMGAVAATGYVEIGGKQRLVLYTSPNVTDQTDDNYSYYVGDFTGSTGSRYATIYDAGDNSPTDFYVDEYYYLYKGDGSNHENDKIFCPRLGNDQWVQQNVFFYNASLHIRCVSYLWIVTSKDNGKTWSVPQMVNDQVRTGADRFYGVGPGAGLCLTDGTIMLPVYTFSNQISSFIYSKDGVHWTRSQDATTSAHWSSESCLVQIDDTTVRHFFRDGTSELHYVDHTWDSTTGKWVTDKSIKDTGALKGDSNGCQLSAIKYSKQLGGKDVIIVSTPTTQARTNGRLYVFTVNADKTMNLDYTYNVELTERYAYSSLTEMNDGSIALLYEGTGDMSFFTKIAMSEIAPGASFDKPTNKTIRYSAPDATFVYDGQPHGITVTVTDPAADAATITYCDTADGTYTADPVTLTNVGTKTVYYKIEAAGYKTVTGSAAVTITDKALSFTAPNVEKVYDGNSYGITVTVTDTGTGAAITPAPAVKYSTTGTEGSYTLTECPTFNAVGTHTVYFQITADGYETRTGSAQVIITAKAMTYAAPDVAVQYDGQPHGITVNVTDPASGAVIEYKGEDGSYSGTNPTFTAAGEYTVYFRITAANYETVLSSAKLTISSTALDTIAYTVNGAGTVNYDGQPHKITVSVTKPASGATVTYCATQNGTYGEDAPEFTDAGDYTVYFKITAQGYTPVAASATLTITGGQPALKQIKYTAPAAAFTWDGAAHGITVNVTDPASGASVTYSDAQNGTYSPTPVTLTEVGTKTVYFKISAAGYEEASGSATLTVNKAPVSLTISASPSTITGAGSVTLTVGGIPDGGAVSVTAASAGASVSGSGSAWTAVLPGTPGYYTFTASYAGDAHHEAATKSCTVTVKSAQADLTALNAAIAKAEALDQSKYTASSWSSMQNALREAKALTTSSTQTAVNSALAKLNAAMTNLELLPPVIPGYTQVTSGTLDTTKQYIVVTQDSRGSIYALYPNTQGMDASTDNAIDMDQPKVAAALTINGSTVEDVWADSLSGDILDVEYNLNFRVEQGDASGTYALVSATGGLYLSLGEKMFSRSKTSLSVSQTGGVFTIKNTGTGKAAYRMLDFNKEGDPKQYTEGGRTFYTNFWGSQTAHFPIYLYANNNAHDTGARARLQALFDECVALTAADYTAMTWAPFNEARSAAGMLLRNENAPDSELTAAYNALASARDALQTAPKVSEPPAGADVIRDWHTMVPASGATQNQPFAPGTAGSSNFRVPSLINLGDEDSFVAVADIRWDHLNDAFGLDTMVSRTTDGGANWSYQALNFFGDSTQVRNDYATSFIDNVMVRDQNGKIYVLGNVFPGGVALNSAPMKPAAASGYVNIDGKQRLVLYTAGRTEQQTSENYNYYIGDFDANGYAPIYEVQARAAGASTGFYVDRYYYLYRGDGTDHEADKIFCQQLGSDKWIQQNVFFYNACLHVRNVSYLWLRTSEDNGATWSDPVIINDQVRTGREQFYGVGPGAGLCTSTGMVILPCYTWSGKEAQRASFIYSSDGGRTWKRSDNATTGDWSGESCLVEINPTTVRQFYRDDVATLRYTDHTWNGTKWVAGTPVVTDAAVTRNNQISAIRYGEPIDGKTAILVSTATGDGESRTHGKIYTFLVDARGDMTKSYEYEVTGAGDGYAYSSLAQAGNSIALLYEGTGYKVTFKTIPITDIAHEGTLTHDITYKAQGYVGAYDGEGHSITVTVTHPEGARVAYCEEQNGTYTEVNPAYTDVGDYTVYFKITDQNHEEKAGSATVKITKAETAITLTSSASSLAGGGNITLTVSGVPDEGSVTVTGSNGATVNKGANGTWTASLPNETKTYIFTAEYTGVNHADAESSCTVEVTYQQTGPVDPGPGPDDPGPVDPGPGPSTPVGPADPGPSGPSGPTEPSKPSTPDKQETVNPDGSTTVTETDKNTGTVTETTQKTDGSTVVVETGKTGTVTTTETRQDKIVVETVEEPDTELKATVTMPEDVKEAVVTIPTTKNEGAADPAKPGATVAMKPGMVAVNVKTGEIIKLSVPTEEGMRVKLEGSAEIVIEDRSKSFADTREHWAEDAVEFVTAREMFNGTGGNNFTPDAPMTRGMLMTVLARFDGEDTSGGAVWYEKGMDWAVSKNISDGSAPNAAITREQLATMLYRYAGSPIASGSLARFKDAGQVSSYAADAMRWAVEIGLIIGGDNGMLDPRGQASRAQVATILARFCGELVQ